MCILFIYTNPAAQTGKYQLILATNRDETFIRNAQPAKKWCDDPVIISGIDLEPGREGGTWLGMSSGPINGQSSIRIGALLNVTGEPRVDDPKGRGFIVTDYLKHTDISTIEYVSKLSMNKSLYNSFNFVAVELSKSNAKIIHFSNVGDKDMMEFEGDATLGFGNSLPEAPLKKVQEGRNRFEEIINQFGDVSKSELLKNELIHMLKWDKRQLPDPELKRRAPNMYEYLSSIFVHIPQVDYGTRTHTIILVDWEGNVDYIESTMECPINQENPIWVNEQIKARL